LAKYWILLGNFEKARDVYEEALTKVMTVRDFSQVFEAYAEFEENVISAEMEDDDGDDQELDYRMARLEKLMDRRPFLVNDVLLRQDQNNVMEWLKRVELYQGQDEQMVDTFERAIDTIKPKKAHGRYQDLWIEYAKFWEDRNQLDEARDVFERALNVSFKHPDSLAEVYIAYSEMELRHDDLVKAKDILARGVMPHSSLKKPEHAVNYLDEGIPVFQRMFKSMKLWGHLVDLEEATGTVESTKAAYDRIMALKICTPQVVINYATFLEENRYFEESFKMYERGIELFGQPIAFDIWNIYLQKFIKRYVSFPMMYSFPSIIVGI